MITVPHLAGVNDPPVTAEEANARAGALLAELSAGPFPTQDEVNRASSAFMERVIQATPFLPGVKVVEILPLPVPGPLPEGLHERYVRRLSNLFRRHVSTRGMCSRRLGRKARRAARRFFRSVARELTPTHRPFLDGYPRTPRAPLGTLDVRAAPQHRDPSRTGSLLFAAHPCRLVDHGEID